MKENLIYTLFPMEPHARLDYEFRSRSSISSYSMLSNAPLEGQILVLRYPKNAKSEPREKLFSQC